MEFLQPAMWHDHDIDFARWLHPAMWHVALESWQWIHQAAAPCNVAGGSGMTCHWIRFWENRLFCILASRSKMMDLRHIGFRGLVMGSLESPCTTSYRSPMDTIALNCIVFEKIAFFCILATNRQTNKQTDKQTDSTDALSHSLCHEQQLKNL